MEEELPSDWPDEHYYYHLLFQDLLMYYVSFEMYYLFIFKSFIPILGPFIPNF